MRTPTETVAASPRARQLDLDELAQMSIGELARMYREAPAPASLDKLRGAPSSRMLALVGPLGRGRLRSAIARFARHSMFPWRGKAFEGERGINRVIFLGRKYPFALSFGPSALDGERCVVLDYDLPENPWIIRRIRDELREVTPGLFLGPALLRTRTEPKLTLFFALDTR